MSDQGFHEVQLSGKQLVFLFMSAIVLLVVTFLLGVDVGRGARAAMGETDLVAQADVTPTPVPDVTAAAAADDAKPAEPEPSYHDMLLGNGAAGDKTPPAEAPPPVNEPVPAPVSEPVKTPVATAAVTPAPAQASGQGEWFLQTGAYSTRAVADGQVAKLKQLKVPAFVVPPASGTPDTLFRVRIGPYVDRAEAEQVKSRIARQGFTPSITR